MNSTELLRKTAKDLASRIDEADDLVLRRVAAAIARGAIERTGLNHPLVSEAMACLESSGAPTPHLQKRLSSLVEELDEEYFRLQELEEDGDEEDTRALVAFSKARAAAAVTAALAPDVRAAAAEAACEAIAAIDDLAYLTAITDKALAA